MGGGWALSITSPPPGMLRAPDLRQLPGRKTFGGGGWGVGSEKADCTVVLSSLVDTLLT